MLMKSPDLILFFRNLLIKLKSYELDRGDILEVVKARHMECWQYGLPKNS